MVKIPSVIDNTLTEWIMQNRMSILYRSRSPNPDSVDYCDFYSAIFPYICLLKLSVPNPDDQGIALSLTLISFINSFTMHVAAVNRRLLNGKADRL